MPEHDPTYSFGSLTAAIRQARLDGIVEEIEIDFSPLRPDPKTGLSTSHFAIGKITYPGDDNPQDPIGRKTGWLVVIKSSLTGNESEPIRNYKHDNPVFPFQTTGDQFFDESQFESYRELGAHMTETTFFGPLHDLLGKDLCSKDWEERFEALRLQFGYLNQGSRVSKNREDEAI